MANKIDPNYQMARDNNLRYSIIKKHIPTNRSFSALDIGSNMGWFSTKIASEYKNSVVFSSEPSTKDIQYHINILRQQNIKNNYILNKAFDPQIAKDLYHSPEYFDITLLLSVVHWFDYPYIQWIHMLGRLVGSSRITIFELPNRTENVPIMNDKYAKHNFNYIDLISSIASLYCKTFKVEEIGATDKCGHKRPIILVRNMIRKESVGRFYKDNTNEVKGELIEYRNKLHLVFDYTHHKFDHKSFTGKKVIDYEYPGLTLWTALNMNIAYPLREDLKNMFLQAGDHPDMTDINMLLTSKGMTAIDTEDDKIPGRPKFDKTITVNKIVKGIA